MYIVKEKEFESVSAISGYKRYSYFIKIVVQTEEAWGLLNDNGWALLESDEGKEVFPLWPACKYAEACLSGWDDELIPHMIPLDELINSLLPHLKRQKRVPGIFFVPGDGCVHVDVDRLLSDLNEELSKYGEGDIYWERELNRNEREKRNPIFPQKES